MFERSEIQKMLCVFISSETHVHDKDQQNNKAYVKPLNEKHARIRQTLCVFIMYNTPSRRG